MQFWFLLHLCVISNVLHQISHNAQSAHACWCNKTVIVLLCVCMEDNPLAKTRGLSSPTYAQTIQCIVIAGLQKNVTSPEPLPSAYTK